MDENSIPGPEDSLEPPAPDMGADTVDEPDVISDVEPPAAPAAPEPPAPPAPPQPTYAPPAAPPYQAPRSPKDRTTAGILAILLGSLGVHKFYLGYTTEGIILLAVTILTGGMLSWASAAVGVVEGIMYLTKTDEEFQTTYVIGRKKWF